MIAALCVRRDSVYFELDCDAFDALRDARSFAGSVPVVAHPPCRGWGRLRTFAAPRAGELDLARDCVAVVRRNGGVLEHPMASSLWDDCGLPRPGQPPRLGPHGRLEWSLSVDQSWWGHPCRKATWLFIVGVPPAQLPPLPYSLALPPMTVDRLGRAARERTPPSLARWLLDLASRVEPLD